MNNKLATSLLLGAFILPTTSLAQQDMMAQMQDVAKCMESIKQQDMQKLEQEGNAFTNKIESLCAKGEKSEAQDLALAFSQKIKDSKVIARMKECIEKVPPEMRAMMPPMMPEEMMGDFTESNVCDRR